MTDFPTITDASLTPFRVIQMLHRANPDLLNEPDCPYPESVKEFLTLLLTGREAEKPSFMDSDDPYAALKHQIAKTLEDMDDLEKLGSGLDNKDRVQLLKAKPMLLERLINLEERVTNAQKTSEFMKLVFDFVDQDLNSDQRTKLMERIGAYIR